MAFLSEEQQKEISETLERLGATQPCPRCGNNSFGVVGGLINQTVQTTFPDVLVGGPIIPCVAVVCGQCGYLAQHAVASLDLSWLRRPDSTRKEESKI